MSIVKVSSIERNMMDLVVVGGGDEKTKLSVLVMVLFEIIFKDNKDAIRKIADFLRKNNLLSDNLSNINYLKIKMAIESMANKQNNITNTYRHNYDEIMKISDGSYGQVYKVFQKYDKSYYAIKKIIITDDLLDEENNYCKEIEIFSKLDNINIVRYYSSFISFDDDTIYDYNYVEDLNIEHTTPILFIQMELCDMTYSDYLMNHESPIEQRLSYFQQILNGVKYLHEKNIIHRDLKPNNIYILNNIIKIGDFGLSEYNNSKNEGSSIGTTFYIAPELYKQSRYDQKIDIYSCGIVYLETILTSKTITEKYRLINNILKKKDLLHTTINEYSLIFSQNMLNENHLERYDIHQTIQHFINIHT